MSQALLFLLILFGALLLGAALSPFEALGWWAGWYGRSRNERSRPVLPPSESAPKAERFIVFLTGIHSVSGETFARREIRLLDGLREHLPDSLVTEVFPYSVTNQALTGQRFFAWFWRLALKLKLSRVAFAGFVINMRNVFQVAVSADARYGPLYNQGTAEAIYDELLRKGFGPSAGPVVLIGYSGGGQIAVGAASYLRELTNAPVTVVSLGGIMCSDPGILACERVYHLVGERDRVERLGHLLFPGRWPLLPYSSWNLAKTEGKLEFISLGQVDHTGKAGYLDSKHMLANGKSNFEQTLDVLIELLRSIKT